MCFYLYCTLDDSELALLVYRRSLGYLALFHLVDVVRLSLTIVGITILHRKFKKHAVAERLRIEALHMNGNGPEGGQQQQ